MIFTVKLRHNILPTPLVSAGRLLGVGIVLSLILVSTVLGQASNIITISPSMGGYISVPTTSSITLNSGEQSSIQAVPTPLYVFYQWEVVSGSPVIESPTSAITNISSNGDAEIKAVFVPTTYKAASACKAGDNLLVSGDIRCQELVIKNWLFKQKVATTPDYVFSKDYTLRPLDSVAKFIEQNSHLPEVPSASAMKEHGLDIVNFNMLLLQKIEELTLYKISLGKKLEELERTIKE